MRLYLIPEAIQKFLNNPIKVLIICLIFMAGSLIFNGTLLKLYNLHRDRNTISMQIAGINKDILEINKQLKMAKDPSYIERQAADLYDLAEDHDLMFVFSDD